MFLNLYLFALACMNNSDKDFYQCTVPWLICLSPYIQVPAGAHHLRFCQVLAKDIVSHADQDSREYNSHIVLNS